MRPILSVILNTQEFPRIKFSSQENWDQVPIDSEKFLKILFICGKLAEKAQAVRVV